MSNINVMRKNLGPVTAYKYAVQQGYTGTEQEFAALMASYATVAEEAEAARDDAIDAKTAAEEAQAAAEAAAEAAEGAIEVDDTLSVEGRAADAKKTGDEITGLKTQIQATNEMVGKYTLVHVSVENEKYYNSSGEKTPNTSWRIIVYDVENLSNVMYSGLTNIGTSPYSVWLDPSGTYIPDSAFKQKTGENYITVPNGAKYVAFSVSNNNSISAIGFTENGLAASIDKLSENITNNGKTFLRKITGWSDIETYTNEYIKSDGTRAKSSYLRTSDYILVNAGDTVYATGMNLNIGGETIFGIACYNANKVFIPNVGITGSTGSVSGSFIVPDGVNYIAISDNLNTNSAFDIDEYTLDFGSQISANTKKFTITGKTICNFGDSIFGNARQPHDISTKLADLTGATVYNCGFGGCRMGCHITNGQYDDWDNFSMYRLADAIATGDWSTQKEAAQASGIPSYFAETVALLETIDFSKVDIITIAYGTNDFADGLRLGGSNDRSTDWALQYSIQTILTAFPNIRIFICVPCYRVWLDSGQFSEDSNTKEVTSWAGGNVYKLTDFVQAEKDIAKVNQLPVIDNYYDLGINRYNWTEYFPANDGTHHNQTGRNLIAEHMARCMW